MRITDINIHKFGAVEGFTLEAAPITVIWGNNESGKTTILDAMLEALFSVSGRQMQDHFQGIDRYDKETELEGNLCIERRGVVLTYPSATGDTLDRLAGFPPVYIRNLLVVRESDLQFYDKYASWWSEIKDHLSGFEGGLDAVAEAIRGEVGLGEDGDWVNLKGRRIRDEVLGLRETERKLDGVQSDVEELTRLRSKLRHLTLQREVTERHLSLLKRARYKEQLETAAVLKRKLTEEAILVAELSRYSDTAHATWRKLETNLSAAEEGLSGLESRKNNSIIRINETEKEVAQREEEARLWARKEAEILPEIETGLQDVRVFYEKEKRLLSYQNFLIGGVIMLLALSLLFIVFAQFRNHIYWLPALTCAGGAGLCAGLWLFRRRLSRKLAVAKQELLTQFHSFGEQAADVNDVESWIFTVRKSGEQAKASAHALLREAEKKRGELQEVTLNIEDRKQHLKRLQLDLEAVKKEFDCESIEEFEARMQQRTHAEDEVKSLREKIGILLSSGLEEDWEKKLAELEQYQDVEILWDEETQARLEREMPRIAEDEKTVNEQCVTIEKKLLELGCNSPEDAWQMAEDVVRRLFSYELDRRAAEIGLGILDELGGHQDTLINTVLESGSDSATYYFRQVTGGRYNNIFWRDNKLYVQTPNGNTLDLESLSTGTRAQLHFSLRVSLLQHLFGGEPLFLLLDDPFLTSDRERIEKLLEMLVDFSKEGWQIFYFTMDEEVPIILKDIGAGNVTVKALQRLDLE